MNQPPTFTRNERAAAAWACACTLLMLDHLKDRQDPEGLHLLSLLPNLPATLESVQADNVQPAQVPTLAAVLHGACEMLDALPAELRHQLNPPPAADLRSALARAGGPNVGPNLRTVTA